ncbi:unnamed protein product [Moneuplotes crassus]|uniref:Uncharacterized protein n=1 Tax=Euplotes crassus TaxID=5936 RepID=A0AAD1XCD8_EUPCR|nr:unnamed protein product [Moneuplotes crassus]
MEKYVTFCAENCGHEAIYYVEETQSYYCMHHFDLNYQPEDGIPLTCPDAVKTKVRRLEKGLEMFLKFAEEKQKSETDREENRNVHTRLTQALEELKYKIEQAEEDNVMYRFTDLNKEASLMKKMIEDELGLNDFSKDCFWKLAKEDDTIPAAASSSSKKAYGLALEQELKTEEAEIGRLEEEVKELKISKSPILPTPLPQSSTTSPTPPTPQESPLEAEMARSSRFRSTMGYMASLPEFTFDLGRKFDRKMLKLVDAKSLSHLQGVCLLQFNKIDVATFQAFISLLPSPIQNLCLSGSFPYPSIYPYIPSILSLSTSLTRVLEFDCIVITKEEKVQLRKAFKGLDVGVEYRKVKVLS